MATNAKHLSIVIFIVWALSCPLLAQTGKFAGGAGEPNNPYQVATAEQLISIGSRSGLFDDHYVLVNDIDLDPNLPGGCVFDKAVIATGAYRSAYSFFGSFNGAGHTIRNLVIRVKSQDPRATTTAGLFGYLDKGALVRNLRIEAADVQVMGSRAGILVGENAGRAIDCQVSGRVSSLLASYAADEVGGLAGRNLGDIVNCRAETEWVLGYRYAGGLVGSNDVTGRIVGCHATGEQVRADRSAAGGLAAVNAGYIIGSWATGGVFSGDSSFAYGGLAGVNAGTILNCHAGSTVAVGTRCSQVGGLVGENQGTIVNCYASGQINTRDLCSSIGGLVGWNCDVLAQWGTDGPVQCRGRIVNSYAATKTLLGTNNREVGGLVGLNAGDVTKSFWDTEASGMTASDGGQGLTTTSMQQAATFLEAGWDFVEERANGITEAWRMPEGGGYPALTLGLDGDNPRRLAGDGTAAAPYQIATSDDLGILWRHDPSACYQLLADLDLAGVRWLECAHRLLQWPVRRRRLCHLPSDSPRAPDRRAVWFPEPQCARHGLRRRGCQSRRRRPVAEPGGPRRMELSGKQHHALLCDRPARGGPWQRRHGRSGRMERRLRGGLLCANGCVLRGQEQSARRPVGLQQRERRALLCCRSRGDCGPEFKLRRPPGNHERVDGEGHEARQLLPDPRRWRRTDEFLWRSALRMQMEQQASFVNWDFKQTWAICAGKDYPRLCWEKVDCDRP